MSLYHLNERRNAQTRSAWKDFTEHRRRVTELIESANTAGGDTLCVLGAGNCNDLDLNRLLQQFQRITLVDIDPSAVTGGVESQLAAQLWPRIEVVALDVTGVFDLLDSWKQNVALPGAAEFRELESAFARRPAVADLAQRYDVVTSICLLSQLIDSLVSFFGSTPGQFVPLVQALRKQHLGTLFDLVCPRGAVALVFDYVSSDTCPDLLQTASNEVLAHSAALIAKGNFFTGLRPDLVIRDFRELGATTAQFRQTFPATVVFEPWKWQIGPRCYLVQGAYCRLG